MTARKSRLTSMQRTFSAKMAVTGDSTYAAEKAGYAFPVQAAAKLLGDPDVQADIQKITLYKLQTGTLKKAQIAHDRLLEDPETPAGALVGAIKLAYDYGFATKGARDVEPSEMTHAELIEAAGVLRQALARRDTGLVDVTPTLIEPEAPQSAQDAPNPFD